MIDSTLHLLLDDTAGSVPASPYGGGGRRAVMPEPASNPPIGQSPASPYTAGFTEPLVRRAAVRTVPIPPALVEPVSPASPVPAPPPVRPDEQDVIPEEPNAYEPSLYEPSLYEPSPTEPDSLEPGGPPAEVADEPTDEPAAESTDVPDETESEPLSGVDEVEDAIQADASAEDPVGADTRSSLLRSIPWIPRAPDPSITRGMSAAQAYMAPVEPSMWFIGPLEESQAPPFVRVRRQGPERVERGLWFASIALILGWMLSAALFHLGHIPSIIALAMAPAGALLYGKGAGSRPQSGAVRLVVLLVVGVLLAWPISLATELSFYYKETTGTSSGAIGYVVSSMFTASLFMAKLKEFLLVALFGLGGVVAVVQNMLATRRRRRRRSDAS